jgi:hypothetical protein
MALKYLFILFYDSLLDTKNVKLSLSFSTGRSLTQIANSSSKQLFQ